MHRSTEIVIQPGGLVFLALGVLILPLRWLVAFIAASAFHELCHYCAVVLCGGQVNGISFDATGIKMSVGHLSGGKELFCALAGPMGALLLLLFVRWIPAVAVCAAVQSAYNLLPFYPLDGGRAMRCAAELFFSESTSKRICDWVGYACLILIWCGAVFAAVWMKLGYIPLIIALSLQMKTNFGKIPCKPVHYRVQ